MTPCIDSFYIDNIAEKRLDATSEALMSEPLMPMISSSDVAKPSSGDQDKLWLVIRSLKTPEGKMVSRNFDSIFLRF